MRRLCLWLLLFIGFALMVAPASPCAGQSVKVVMDNNYPPFAFVNQSGQLQGILVDQWRLWERKTGIRAELTGVDWGEALRRMQAGEFDVIDTIFDTESRRALFDFTPPYQRLEVPIFFASEISGITDAASLRGFPVAVKAGDAAIEQLQKSGVTHLIPYASYEAIVRAAAEHKVNVFVIDKPPALYFLHKYGIVDRFRESKPLNMGEFHRAVAKGNGALLQTVEQGFKSISAADYRDIEEKWYGNTIAQRGGFQPRHLLYALTAVVAIIALLLVSNRLLRRLVSRRTAELAASEGRLRTLLRTIPELVWLKDPNGVFLACNPRFERFFGAKEEEIVGRTDYDFVDRDLADFFREHDLKAIAAGGPSVNEEWVTYVDDGHRELLETIKTPMRDADGNLMGVLGVARDITEKRELEEKRLKLEQEWERNQRLESLGVLAGGIAHDFNNILTGILGNISIARMVLHEEYKTLQRLSACEQACHRAAELTQQLLTFAKGGKPVRTVVDTRKLVEEALSFALHGANVKGVLECPADILWLHADAGQITQVFHNLLINAKQAMPNGGVVTVRLENAVVAAGDGLPVEAGEYVRAIISDQGFGIPAENLSRIFDPYFTTKEQGSGLGLSSVYSIVTRHGGSTAVASNPGVGTVFTLLLPATRERGGEGDVNRVAAALSSGGRVLVMDDEELIRDLVTVMLGEQGFEVHVCGDGREAVVLHGKAMDAGRPYAAVILDLTVPGGMGGKEAATAIRRIDPDTPLIVSSGYSGDALIAECRQYGFDGVVMKPYSLDTLLAELSRVISGRRTGSRGE